MVGTFCADFLCIFVPVWLWNKWLDSERAAVSQLKTEFKDFGLAMTIEELLPPAVSDEQNAAFIYNEIFSSFPRYSESSPFHLLIDAEPEDLKSGEYLEYLKDPTVILALEKLHKIRNYPNCRWQRNYADGLNMEFPHISHLHSAMKLLMAAYQVSGDEHYLRDGLQLVLHMYDSGGVLIEFLVAISLEALLLRELEQSSDPQGYMEQLSGINLRHAIIDAVQFERITIGEWVFDHLQNGTFDADYFFHEEDISGRGFIFKPLKERDRVFFLQEMLRWHRYMESQLHQPTIDLSLYADPKEFPFGSEGSQMALPALSFLVEKVADLEQQRRHILEPTPTEGASEPGAAARTQ